MPIERDEANVQFTQALRPLAAAGLALAGLLSLPATASAIDAYETAEAMTRPVVTAFALPGDRVYPEGIAADARNGDLYVGSFGTGAVYRSAPGQAIAEVFLPAGADGRAKAIGVKVDQQGRLWVIDPAGVTLYDTGTRERVARFVSPTPETSLVNDLDIATDGTGYLTDSTRALVYKVTPSQVKQAAEAGGAGGQLAPAYDLSGTVAPQPAGTITLNGIEADPSGRFLLTVDSAAGDLYRLDVATGAVHKVELHGATLRYGDGMHMEDGSLWVAHYANNTLSRLRVAGDGMAATMEKQLTDPSLQIPTTLVRRHGRLYVVRSQFDKGGPIGPGVPDAPFTVAEVRGM